MDWIVVEGVKPWDGRYEFDLGAAPLTTREWGFIKRLSGYLPLNLDKGFEGGDPELYACFAAIALRRAGKVDNHDVAAVYERIIDSPFETTIRLDTDAADEGDDAGPPPQSSNGSTDFSGIGSSTSSETSLPPQKPSGTPGSATSPSAQPTSVT